jgi:hypothetical protein
MNDDIRVLIDALLNAERPSDERIARALSPESCSAGRDTPGGKTIIGALLSDTVWCAFRRDASTGQFTARVWQDEAEAGPVCAGDSPSAALKEAVNAWAASCDVKELGRRVAAARAAQRACCPTCGRSDAPTPQ